MPAELLAINAPEITKFDDIVTDWPAVPRMAAFKIVTLEVWVWGAVQILFVLKMDDVLTELVAVST